MKLLKKSVIAAAVALACTGAQAADVVLSDAGSFVRATINDKGTFSTATGLGLEYKGVEFVNIDTRASWFWYKDNTGSVVADIFGGTGFAGTTTSLVSPTFLSVTSTPFGAGIAFTENYELSGDNRLSVSVSIKNNTGAAITDAWFGAGIDPDQGGSGKNATVNSILGQGNAAAVRASDPTWSNKMVTMANTTSADADAVRAFVNTASCCLSVDPSLVFSGPLQAIGFISHADDSISMNYHIGALAMGETAVVGYDYIFAPIPEPETYAMMLAGLGLMGFIARRRKLNAAA